MSDHIRLTNDPFHPHRWRLEVDDTIQSYVDLDEPESLRFAHHLGFGAIVDATLPAPEAPLRVLQIGGGALTIPRYVTATRRGSTQYVIEADTQIAALVAQQLPLPPGSGIDVAVDKGEHEVARQHASGTRAAYDLIMVDAFVGPVVPPALVAYDFLAQAHDLLAISGVFAINTAAPHASLQQLATSLRELWPHRWVLGADHVHRGGAGPLIFIGTTAGLDTQRLTQAAGALETPEYLQPL